MGVSSLLDIGVTALQTSNKVLDVTGHNIANANTPGYTRQSAMLQNIPTGAVTSSGDTGRGVQITGIQRMYNSFVSMQLNAENSKLSYWNNYQTGIKQVEDIFNEASTTGISPAITDFFSAWQDVAQSPEGTAQRTTLIQKANYLASRLNSASITLNDERSQLLSDGQSLASKVNTTAAQIADLNSKIEGNPGALDLMDQRDALVQQMNQIVKVSTFTENTGAISVLIGGNPIVQGSHSYTMSVNADTNNMMRVYVATQPNASPGSTNNPDITTLVTGGQIGADLYLRDTKITAYMNKLNNFAVDLSDTVNSYQKQGYGLDGSPGGNFFQPLSFLAKYTSVDSVKGVFTSPSNVFSTNGGTLTIKLGDNDLNPASVTVAAGATLNDVVNAINSAAGSKVTAAVVNSGPAGTFTTTGPYTIATDKNSITVPSGTYTAATLASAINTLGAAAVPPLGINVIYDNTQNQFTITSTGGPTGATQVLPASTIGTLLGFNFSGSPTIGSGLPGAVPAPPDYRISIKSNPDGNLGNVRIGVTTTDNVGSGLDLLATSPASEYTITASNNTIQTNIGTGNIAAGIYSGASLASAINALPGLGITVAYNSATSQFTITNAGANQVNSSSMETTLGFSLANHPIGAAGAAITGTPSISTTAAPGTVISSMSVSNPDSTVSNAQYKIDYVNDAVYDSLASSVQSGYQLESGSDTCTVIAGQNDGIRLSTDGGVTWNTYQIPAGTYTRPQLAKALENILTGSDGQLAGANARNTATVTYDNTTNGKFVIDNPKPFVIDNYNNSINFTVGNTTYTATIPAGTYTDDAGGNKLSTAIANAMNKADGGVPALTATCVNPADILTINNPGGGPAVTINWANSSATPQQFGFTPVGGQNSIPSGGNLAAATAMTALATGNLTFDWANAGSTAANMFGFLKTDPQIPVNLAGAASASDYSVAAYHWRVMKSTNGSTWTAIDPNTTYNQSNPSTIDETKVNLATDSSSSSPSTSGYFWRTLEFEGVKVKIDGDVNQSNSNGGSFAVQLDPNAARDIATSFTDPKLVAASTDMFTVDSTKNSVIFNVNGSANITATIPAGSYTNDPVTGATDDVSAALKTAIETAYNTATGNTLPDTLQVAFNQTTKQFKIVLQSGSDTINFLWSNSGSTAKQIFGFSGSDTPVAAGVSAVSDNPASVLQNANQGIPGDNRNATAIAALATQSSFAGSTPIDFYNSLVSDIGVEASSANSSQTFQSGLVDQLNQRRGEVSGVSLDEEAANLVMYEKAYEAAAKMISVADTLLTTLLSMTTGQ